MAKYEWKNKPLILLPQSKEEVTLLQLAHGLEPKTHNRNQRHFEIGPHSDKLGNLARFYDKTLEDTEMFVDSDLTVGMVLENLTPASPGDEAPEEPRFGSKDPDYRAGQPRGLMLVWHPKHHISLLEPSCLPLEDVPLNERMAFYSCTLVYGPYEYMRKIKYLSIVNIEYPNHKDKTYALLRVNPDIDPSDLPKVKQNKPKTTSPKLSSDDPFKDAVQEQEELDEMLSAVEQGVPVPEERPSPKSKNIYHSSVDKELLKYPSPEHGYQDWTGAGEGTVSKTKGRQASGKPCHYLTGNETDEKGKVIVSLPSDLAYDGGSWMKIHRAALEPFRALVNQARADGIPAPCLLAYSTFRRLKDQRKNFRKYLFGKYGGDENFPIYDPTNKPSGLHEKNAAAYRRCRVYNGDPDDPALIRRGIGPGGDHLCGRGIDMYLGVSQNAWADNYQKKHKVRRGAANRAFKEFMRNSNIYRWLEINAEFFGFYNYEAEPWHWAYNPDDRPNRQDTPDRLPGPSEMDKLLADSEALMNDEG